MKELARMKAFGKKVRRVRLGEGWTQIAVAKKLKVSNQHISNIENGTYVARNGIETSVKVKKKLADFFGVNY